MSFPNQAYCQLVKDSPITQQAGLASILRGWQALRPYQKCSFTNSRALLHVLQDGDKSWWVIQANGAAWLSWSLITACLFARQRLVWANWRRVWRCSVQSHNYFFWWPLNTYWQSTLGTPHEATMRFNALITLAICPACRKSPGIPSVTFCQRRSSQRLLRSPERVVVNDNIVPIADIFVEQQLGKKGDHGSS